MATKRIKDLTNTAASVASDAYLAIDGTSNGTEKITRDNFRQDTADAFVAAPGTYNLAPLSGGAVEVAKGGTGATTAAGARTNLSVNSIDEDAEAAGTKLVGPALYFDGVNDYLEVADDAKLSFTDGTDDLPFSIAGWVNMGSLTNFTIASKFQTGQLEWMLYHAAANGWTFRLQSGSTYCTATTGTSESNTDQWVHVCASYAGSGPNSTNDFPAAMDAGNVDIYINGVAQSLTRNNDVGGSYAGMTDGTATVNIGQFNNAGATYSKGHIRDVKIFNRELSANEVVDVMDGDLGFADEWGGALGGVYTQDSTPSGEWTTVGGTDSDEAGPIGGRSNILKFTANTANSAHYVAKTPLIAGKRCRVELDYFIPSGQSNIDGIRVDLSGVLNAYVNASPTLDTWTRVSFEAITTGSSILIYALDGGLATFTDAGGDDVFYIDGCKITEIGTLASFSAERFDSSTDKLYDQSDNAFIGTNNGATLVGREVPVYETGTWTPSLYFAGTSAATYSVQDGYYSRVGDTVYIRGSITLSGIGASSGAVSVAGLPFQPSGDGASSSVMPVHMTAALNLTSSPTGLVEDGVSQILLYDAGATGQTALDETNFGASTVLKIAGTYKIQ